MDRKKKKTIILLAMILLLVVANGAASAWNDKSEKKKEKEAEASKIYLTDASDITAYSYSDGSQNMSFAKVDDTWEYDEDNEITMNQDTVQSTADAIRQMEAVRELKNPDQLSDYGLDKPSYTIQFQDNDGDNRNSDWQRRRRELLCYSGRQRKGIHDQFRFPGLSAI